MGQTVSIDNYSPRIVSGMRASGTLHLGHYHGVIKNWLRLQNEYDCFIFVADWHALTTQYEHPQAIHQHAMNMVVDWLACGLNPNQAKIFIQSWVPEHAELHLLLSMLTPLSWLERVPTYKEQQSKLTQLDLSTYGFLGYPLLQAADVLLYKGHFVPVGEDQVPHIELIREVARRFNFLYGRETDFELKAEQAIKKLGKRNAELYQQYRKKIQEQGDMNAKELAEALLDEQKNIPLSDRERLSGYLTGSGKILLPEPQPLLTPSAKLPGLDGQKMSKSYGNTIALGSDNATIEQQIKTMPTDPARVRRSDPGEPEKCPVWGLHKVYTDADTHQWVQQGCRSAGIGCLECKRPLIDKIQQEQTPIRERRQEYQKDVQTIRSILHEGAEAAREAAAATLDEVREAMGLQY